MEHLIPAYSDLNTTTMSHVILSNKQIVNRLRV